MGTYVIENNFLYAEIMAYGAIIKQLQLKKDEIPLVVSYPSVEDYKENPMHLGACVGRYAGRIRNYTLNEKPILLTKEEFVLHGAEHGWDKKTWKIVEHKKNKITLELECPHNEKGHPGNVKIVLVYRFVGMDLEIEYSAHTDAPTPMNPTQHSYFNFNGFPIEEHQLKIYGKRRLALLENLLPNGEFIENHGDHFTEHPMPIGEARYDDVFVVEDSQKPIAELLSPDRRLSLKVYTDQKAVVIFVSGNVNGICFETQGFPDAPNFSHFPTTLLNPGETYKQKTRYSFSIASIKS